MDFPPLDNVLSPSQLLTGHEHNLPSRTPRNREPTTILSLPYEILLRITHLLALLPYTPDQPSTHVADSLKSIRLTHSSFTTLPLHYLFSQLTLPLWGPRGLLRLYNISQHEHLARHVQHVKFRVQFNLAEPHPAPFQEANLRRASQDLLSVRDPPPRRRDRLRASVSGALEGRLGALSLGSRGKGRRSSKVPIVAIPSSSGDDGVGAVSSGSTLPASTFNGDVVAALQRRQSTWPPLPDYKTDPVDFLATFDRMAQTTISRNLGLSELSVAEQKNVGPSPMLRTMMALMSGIFSKLSRLQTLCVDSQTQEEFMERLDRGYALRYAPTQETWEAISGYVVAMLVAGWVRSSCQVLRRLWVMGGAVGWGRVLMREYLASEKEITGIMWTGNSFEEKEAKCASGNEEQTGLEMWKRKAARLESLTLKYDAGAYTRYFVEVEEQWMCIVRELMQDMPSLQCMEIGRQKRADGAVQGWPGWGAVKLSNIASHSWQGGHLVETLKILRIGDVRVADAADLKRCLEALGGVGLERLYMGNFDIGTNDWPAAWKILKEGCDFRLKKIALMGKRYGSLWGYWAPNQPWLARWDGDISSLGDAPPLLGHVQEYVEGKRDVEDFPLLSTEQVGARAAFEQWQRRSDETLKYTSYPQGA